MSELLEKIAAGIIAGNLNEVPNCAKRIGRGHGALKNP